jgi:hypothetical protein
MRALGGIAIDRSAAQGLAFIDHATRTIGVDTYISFTGDEARDLATLREYYVTKRGKHPALEGTIAFP